MAKHGPLGFLLPAALGIGALATGGFGLPALLGGEGAAAAGAGEAAATGAEGALTAGAAAPLEAGAAAAPLEAGAPGFLIPGTETAISGGLPLGTIGGDVAAGGALEAGTAGATNIAELGPAGVSGLEAAAGPSVNLGETIPGSFLPGVQAATSTLGPADAATGFGGSPGFADTFSGLWGNPGFDASGGTVAGSDAFDPSGGAFGAGEDFSGGQAGSTFGDIFKEVGGLRGLTSLLSAGLLGSQLFKGVQQYPEQQTLGQQAAGYQQTGQALTQPLFTGALPAGAQSAVDASAAASKARTRSTFANLGLTGSTMEAQALQAVDQNKAGQTFEIADQLLGQALPYSQLGTRTTEDLLRTAMQEDADYRAALANFSRALAGTGAALPTAV